MDKKLSKSSIFLIMFLVFCIIVSISIALFALTVDDNTNSNSEIQQTTLQNNNINSPF